MNQPSYDEIIQAIDTDLDSTRFEEIKVIVSQYLKEQTMTIQVYEDVTAPYEEFNQESNGDFSEKQLKEVNYMGVQNLNFGTTNFNPSYRKSKKSTPIQILHGRKYA